MAQIIERHSIVIINFVSHVVDRLVDSPVIFLLADCFSIPFPACLAVILIAPWWYVCSGVEAILQLPTVKDRKSVV